MVLDAFSYTNKGGRSVNEDSAGFLARGGCGLFVVADGLGGHSFGEMASACVRDTLLSAYDPMSSCRPEWLIENIARANLEILARQKEMKSVLKSTVACLVVDGEQAVWANVGDTRLYRLHDGEIYSYTNDHSVAFKKFKAGEITRDQIAGDEDQTCLLRSLGSEDRNEPEVTVSSLPIGPGDAFMLCTDGAWEYIKDEEIAIDLLKSHTAEEWCELLLLRVMSRISEENDNLTILTVMVK